jgi:hypothetical protein
VGLWRVFNIGTRSARTEHSNSNIHFWQAQVRPVVSLWLTSLSGSAPATCLARISPLASATRWRGRPGKAAPPSVSPPVAIEPLATGRRMLSGLLCASATITCPCVSRRGKPAAGHYTGLSRPSMKPRCFSGADRGLDGLVSFPRPDRRLEVRGPVQCGAAAAVAF